MSDQISRDMRHRINESKFYCIMIDETTDVSNKEQMVLCLRSVFSHHIVLDILLYTIMIWCCAVSFHKLLYFWN